MKQGTVSFQLHYVHIKFCYCVYTRHFFWNAVYLLEIGKANIFRSCHCLCLALGETWRGTDFVTVFAGLASMRGVGKSSGQKAPIGKSWWAFPAMWRSCEGFCFIDSVPWKLSKRKQVRGTETTLSLWYHEYCTQPTVAPSYITFYLPELRGSQELKSQPPTWRRACFLRLEDRGRKKPFWL